jgi:hypothetical protein
MSDVFCIPLFAALLKSNFGASLFSVLLSVVTLILGLRNLYVLNQRRVRFSEIKNRIKSKVIPEMLLNHQLISLCLKYGIDRKEIYTCMEIAYDFRPDRLEKMKQEFCIYPEEF